MHKTHLLITIHIKVVDACYLVSEFDAVELIS